MIPGTALMKIRNDLRLLPDRVIKHPVHNGRIRNSYCPKTFGFDPVFQKDFSPRLLGRQGWSYTAQQSNPEKPPKPARVC